MSLEKVPVGLGGPREGLVGVSQTGSRLGVPREGSQGGVVPRKCRVGVWGP